jgi:hypothetical protein
MTLPNKDNDPVLTILAKIRSQIDEVTGLVREERKMIEQQKGLQDNATDK